MSSRPWSAVPLAALLMLGCAPDPVPERPWPDDDDHQLDDIVTTPSGGVRVLLWTERGAFIRESSQEGVWTEVVAAGPGCVFLDQRGGVYRVAGGAATGAVERFESGAWVNLTGEVALHVPEVMGAYRPIPRRCAMARTFPDGAVVLGPDLGAVAGEEGLLRIDDAGVERLPLALVRANSLLDLHVDPEGTLWVAHEAVQDETEQWPKTRVQRWSTDGWQELTPATGGETYFIPSTDGVLHLGSLGGASRYGPQDRWWFWDGLSRLPPHHFKWCALTPAGEPTCLVVPPRYDDDKTTTGYVIPASGVPRELGDIPSMGLSADDRPLVVTADALVVGGNSHTTAGNFGVVARLRF